MSDSDYKNLKRKIFERYLMEAPVVQGVQPLAFLVSDMYHFLKNGNPTQDPTKIQTILKAWVADPNVNTIPQPMLTAFINSGNYFGACNQTWLPITTNEFAILPFKNWYDAGTYGEKLIDGNVDLLVANDPFAAKLLEMHKAAAKNAFKGEVVAPTKFYDSYGIPITAPVAVALPSIFEPFADEMLQIPKVKPPTGSVYFPGLSSKCDAIDQTERTELENYVNKLITKTDLMVGGGSTPEFNTAKLAYYDVRKFQKDMLANYYGKNLTAFSETINGVSIDLIHKCNNDSNLSTNYVYLFHYISYVVNKISDGKFTSLPSAADKTYIDKLNSFVNNVVNKFKQAIIAYNSGTHPALPKCKPMFLEILSCSTHDYCELFIDVEPQATESCVISENPGNPDELVITYENGILFAGSKGINITFSNTVYSILHNDGDTTTKNANNSMHKEPITGGDLRITTAMSFMQNGYRKYIKAVIGDAEYEKRQVEINHLIDGIGMTFDFIIVKIDNKTHKSKLYGVRCN